MIRKLTLCSINVNIVHFVRGKRGIQNANTANDYGSYRQKSGPYFQGFRNSAKFAQSLVEYHLPES